MSGNLAEWNDTAGFDIDGGTGTSFDNNQLLDNRGEGFSHHAGATGSVVTNNTMTGNRTDVCNDGGITTFTGNIFTTGGTTTACVIDN